MPSYTEDVLTAAINAVNTGTPVKRIARDYGICHDPCRDMRTSVNSPRLMVEPRNIRLIKDGSFGSKRSKLSEISRLSYGLYGGCFDWIAYFYIVNRFLFEPFPRYLTINLI